MFKIIAFFIMTLFDWLYARVGILLLCGKYFHKHNISPSGINHAMFFKVSVSSQENE
jgi:hypothetical protein